MPGRYLDSSTLDQISIQLCSGLKLWMTVDWMAVRVGPCWVCDLARGDSSPVKFTGLGLSLGQCRAETLPACCSLPSRQPPSSAFLHFLFHHYCPKPAPAPCHVAKERGRFGKMLPLLLLRSETQIVFWVRGSGRWRQLETLTRPSLCKNCA